MEGFWKFSFIFIVCCLMAFVIVVLLLCAGVENYPLTTVVTDITNDIVSTQDCNGNIWQFKGAEDWAVGDIASLLMENNKTSNIFDDKIIFAKYNGTAADFMGEF